MMDPLLPCDFKCVVMNDRGRMCVCDLLTE